MARKYEFMTPEFDTAASAAGHQAFLESLAAGLPAFYLDDGVEVMELSDGRRFEIRWIPGAPSGENYTVVRELKARAA